MAGVDCVAVTEELSVDDRQRMYAVRIGAVEVLDDIPLLKASIMALGSA